MLQIIQEVYVMANRKDNQINQNNQNQKDSNRGQQGQQGMGRNTNEGQRQATDRDQGQNTTARKDAPRSDNERN